MAKEKRFCQMCGTLFIGIATAHFCKKCRKERNRMLAKKEYEKKKNKLKKSYKNAFYKGEIPKKIPYIDPFLGSEKKYCSAYNPEEIECIKCFEYQTKEYKRCKK